MVELILDADQAARLVAAFGGVAVLLTALEYLSRPALFADDGVMGFDALQKRSPSSSRSGFVYAKLRPLLAYPGVLYIYVARVAAAVLLVGFLWGAPWGQAIGVVVVYVTGVVLVGIRWRPPPFSELINHTVFGALTIKIAVPDSPLVAEACLWFISAQILGSYLYNGLWKLRVPEWRDGTYVAAIADHRFWGSGMLRTVLKRWPGLGPTLTWGSISFEILFPLVLVIAYPWNLVVLSIGALFHLQIALTMGINSFFWSYLSTYPALLFCSLRLQALLFG